jgi:hypothetical protein
MSVEVVTGVLGVASQPSLGNKAVGGGEVELRVVSRPVVNGDAGLRRYPFAENGVAALLNDAGASYWDWGIDAQRFFETCPVFSLCSLCRVMKPPALRTCVEIFQAAEVLEGQLFLALERASDFCEELYQDTAVSE